MLTTVIAHFGGSSVVGISGPLAKRLLNNIALSLIVAIKCQGNLILALPALV